MDGEEFFMREFRRMDRSVLKNVVTHAISAADFDEFVVDIGTALVRTAVLAFFKRFESKSGITVYDCEDIVEIFTMFDDDEIIVASAIRAVCNFAKNGEMLMKNGIGTSILAALKAFGTNNNNIANRACWIVDRLVEDASSSWRAEAVEPVVAALDAFGTTCEQIACNACSAVDELARYEREKLIAAGAPKAVIATLKAFGTTNSTVAKKACGAVFMFTKADGHAHEVIDACDAVVATLLTLGKTDIEVAEIACRIAYELANCQEHREQLRAAVEGAVQCPYKEHALEKMQ